MVAPNTRQAPYIHSGKNVRDICADTIIACLPIAAGGILLQGWSAVATLFLCVLTCFTLQFILQRRVTAIGMTQLYFAIFIGLALGLTLPKNVPWWGALTASTAAMLFGTMLWGGLGKNMIHPVAVGCASLLLIPALQPQPLREMTGRFILGYDGGALGECGSVLILLGALYLIYRRGFSYAIALPYLIAAFFTALCIPNCNAIAVVLWGGSVLGGVILASDSVTSPIATLHKVIYGVGCGVLCTLLAYYFWGMGGIAVGILIMNLLGRGGEYLALLRTLYHTRHIK